ncbi:MAG: ABC transporter substrate-binding protein, partial [Krumholzibacteria bacterium]|nr:ABC transporter substrate-binding protein [Candidatus Krumholzibacteria bacterium]
MLSSRKADQEQPMAYRRIASLVPSLTQTVCALGARHRLVARTIYCAEPRDELAAVPACGGTKNPDLARILAMQPDLALCCDEENKPEHRHALAAAGVTVHTVMPRSLDDVDALLRDYGGLLGAGGGADL